MSTVLAISAVMPRGVAAKKALYEAGVAFGCSVGGVVCVLGMRSAKGSSSNGLQAQNQLYGRLEWGLNVLKCDQLSVTRTASKTRLEGSRRAQILSE